MKIYTKTISKGLLWYKSRGYNKRGRSSKGNFLYLFWIKRGDIYGDYP
jgi:hypothetical protein